MSLTELMSAEKTKLYNIESQLQFVETGQADMHMLSDQLEQCDVSIGYLEGLLNKEPLTTRGTMRLFDFFSFFLFILFFLSFFLSFFSFFSFFLLQEAV